MDIKQLREKIEELINQPFEQDKAGDEVIFVLTDNILSLISQEQQNLCDRFEKEIIDGTNGGFVTRAGFREEQRIKLAEMRKEITNE